MSYQAVSHYQIIKRLGAGGMGEVYLAEDTLLDRRVAIKFLAPDSVADDQAKRRLIREAKAAAKLDHTNICSIYEVAEENGTSFIVMQYIEGETLAGRMQKKPLELGETLDVTVQLADALAEAHSHGIIHSDIKPANIMLTARGQVKVLDFGLAKVVRRRSSVDSQAETQSLLTEPGVIVGTVPYMSPEQVRGEPLDARSDIFSFGVVLFEMVSGRNPFQAESVGATMSLILTKDPAPLARYASDVPDELQRIVCKTLSKDKEGRYQGIKDLLIDLSKLKQKLDVEAEIERTAAPEERGAAGESKHYVGRQVVATAPSAATKKTEGQLAARVSQAGAARATSSVEYVVSEIKRHRRGAALFGAALVILLGGVSYALYRFLGQPKITALPFQTTKVTKLTATGKARDAAISPDGKYVVYVEGEAKQQSLWVRQIATGSSVEIVPPAQVVYFGLTFSNDGNYVYYVKMELSDGVWVLYRVPSLGGASKKLIEPLDSAVTFSPDGQRFAFVRSHRTGKGNEPNLMLANADGTEERILATRKLPDFFDDEGVVRMAWSPDGKTIACPAGRNDANGRYYSVVGVSVEDGSEKPLTSQKWNDVTQVAWLSGGSGLAVLAVEQGDESRPQQLWHLSYPGGEVRRITNDLNAYASVSLTRDSDALVTVQSNRTSSIWIAPKGDVGRATQITSGTRDGQLSWTPDGRIVYRSRASSNSDIWIVEADGRNQARLTHEGSNFQPTVSPDGRYIVFSSTRAGKLSIWRMDIDGGNPRPLSVDKFLYYHLSPDGRWVVYSGDGLWKVPIDGGDPVQLTKINANVPVVSPDGKHIACFYWDEHENPSHGVMILPFEGGQPTKRLKIFSSPNAFVLNWTPDGRALMYIHLSNIWSQPVDGGNPEQLTAFQGDQLFNFAYSPDSKWLAVARGRATDDVVLIADSK